ncbi:MAG TPA: GAF domain-containing sensor histidine kinase [Candidatus Dormibacteraeota bacterium]|nr:GAF domain-containing sensor histidine kinase [Candidatus Dormibacteraeota bacterium]
MAADADDYRRLTALLADCGTTLARGGAMSEVLQRCAGAVVERLDAAFARVWVLEPDGETLALRASAGLYTHLDGEHSRVRVGELKIGAIAADCRPVLTNDVAHDPRIDDHAWARATAMVAFAGHPLIVDGRVVGVLALFSCTALGPPVIDHLGSVADAIAQFVARRRAVEEERERLARELHDSVTQAIYGVALGARSTLTMLRRGEPEAAAAALEEVAAMADTALTEMRELLVELHPGALLEQGLRAALERVAAAVASRYRGVAVECVPGVEPALTAAAREALYRIGQEALRNAVRHGRPGRVEVRLREQGGGVILEVSDDGAGFDPAAVRPGRLGLVSMRERAAGAGGRLEIDSRPGAGTTIRASVPSSGSSGR